LIERPESLAIQTLLQRADFLRAKRGRKQHANCLSVQCIANDSVAIRVGLTVSKHCGNAVARNKIKRRLRHCVREIFPAHAAPGHDYVIIARKEAASIEFAELLRQFTHCLSRLA
jgi:ribonuclease P protein component